jgi:Meckel syndrome type 1 protein
MDEQTPINARPKRQPPEAVEDFSLALRDRVLWPLEDHFRALSDEGRIAVAGAAAVLALGIGVLGFSALGSGGSQATSAAQVAAAPAPTAQPAPAAPRPEPAPTLHGAAPVFKAPQEDQGEVANSKAVESEAAATTADNTGNAATDTISSTPAAQPAGAAASASASASTATTVDGPPAGPAAVAVAREFAEGFVVYETGGDKGTIHKAFTATATPELAKALLRRPPRQPAGVKVPKAKVLNVVPAPSHGSIYPLSVSLLRVGVTSELRLEMEQLKHKGWRVTNVLG